VLLVTSELTDFCGLDGDVFCLDDVTFDVLVRLVTSLFGCVEHRVISGLEDDLWSCDCPVSVISSVLSLLGIPGSLVSESVKPLR
jgi:hypothetical protein